MDLFGVTIDKDLTFKKYSNVFYICKKVNNEFSVITKFVNLISTYCSMV